MYSQPMTSENQGLSNPAIMSHPPEHQVPPDAPLIYIVLQGNCNPQALTMLHAGCSS